MMSSALTTKLFCLLLVTACSHISATSPTQGGNAQAGNTTTACPPAERVMRILNPLIKLWKFSLWILATAEIATIIATAYPSSPFSDLVLSILLFEREQKQIRLTMARIASVPVAVIATMIRLSCYRELGKHFTFELTIHKDHVLVTTGPYGFVRHPSYTGFFLICLALYLLHGTRGSWVRESGLMQTIPGSLFVYILLVYTLTGFVAAIRRMYDEDRVLRDRFGRKWDDWASRVPYALIPGIL